MSFRGPIAHLFLDSTVGCASLSSHLLKDVLAPSKFRSLRRQRPQFSLCWMWGWACHRYAHFHSNILCFQNSKPRSWPCIGFLARGSVGMMGKMTTVHLKSLGWLSPFSEFNKGAPVSRKLCADSFLSLVVRFSLKKKKAKPKTNERIKHQKANVFCKTIHNRKTIWVDAKTS